MEGSNQPQIIPNKPKPLQCLVSGGGWKLIWEVLLVTLYVVELGLTLALAVKYQEGGGGFPLKATLTFLIVPLVVIFCFNIRSVIVGAKGISRYIQIGLCALQLYPFARAYNVIEFRKRLREKLPAPNGPAEADIARECALMEQSTLETILLQAPQATLQLAILFYSYNDRSFDPGLGVSLVLLAFVSLPLSVTRTVAWTRELKSKDFPLMWAGVFHFVWQSFVIASRLWPIALLGGTHPIALFAVYLVHCLVSLVAERDEIQDYVSGLCSERGSNSGYKCARLFCKILVYFFVCVSEQEGAEVRRETRMKYWTIYGAFLVENVICLVVYHALTQRPSEGMVFLSVVVVGLFFAGIFYMFLYYGYCHSTFKDVPTNDGFIYAITGRSDLKFNKLIRATWDGDGSDIFQRVLITAILKSGTCQVNAIDHVSGLTALHFACLGGDPKMIRILLEHGASVEIEAARDFYDEEKNVLKICKGDRALHVLARFNHAEAIPELKKFGVSPNTVTKEALSALHIAVDRDFEEATGALLEAGVDPSLQDREGNTALHISAGRDNSKIFQKLLLRSGGKLEIKNQKGQTPHLLGVERRAWELVRSLALHGADLNTEDTNGNTPLLLVVKEFKYFGEEDLMEESQEQKLKGICFLVGHGADPWRRNRQNLRAIDELEKFCYPVETIEKIFARAEMKGNNNGRENLDPPQKFKGDCVTCDNETQIMFGPCGHAICCQECGSKMEVCLVCMARVKTRYELVEVSCCGTRDARTWIQFLPCGHLTHCLRCASRGNAGCPICLVTSERRRNILYVHREIPSRIEGATVPE